MFVAVLRLVGRMEWPRDWISWGWGLIGCEGGARGGQGDWLWRELRLLTYLQLAAVFIQSHGRNFSRGNEG